MDFIKVNKESFKVCKHLLSEEKINEYGFTPICVYAPFDNASFCLKGDFAVLKLEEKDKTYINILGDFRQEEFYKIIEDILSETGECNLCFLSEEKKSEIVRRFQGRIKNITYDETQSDYIYKISDFTNLSGNLNRHKREQYNSFVNNNNYSYYEITKENKNECIEICEKWCKRKDCALCEYTCELNIIKEIVNNLDFYPVKGGIITIDNEPSAFFIGEILGDCVMGYHQKTATPFVKGLGCAIYIEAMKNTFSECTYFNMGPDLGIDGLKQFKRMIKPYTLVDKYTIELK